MTKKDFINNVQTKVNDMGYSMSKSVTNDFCNAVFSAITDAVSNGDNVKWRDFGTFSTVVIPEHKANNPKTGEKVVVEEHNRVKFKPASYFKTSVNQS